VVEQVTHIATNNRPDDVAAHIELVESTLHRVDRVRAVR
jgi:hypothetical protein